MFTRTYIKAVYFQGSALIFFRPLNMVHCIQCIAWSRICITAIYEQNSRNCVYTYVYIHTNRIKKFNHVILKWNEFIYTLAKNFTSSFVVRIWNMHKYYRSTHIRKPWSFVDKNCNNLKKMSQWPQSNINMLSVLVWPVWRLTMWEIDRAKKGIPTL